MARRRKLISEPGNRTGQQTAEMVAAGTAAGALALAVAEAKAERDLATTHDAGRPAPLEDGAMVGDVPVEASSDAVLPQGVSVPAAARAEGKVIDTPSASVVPVTPAVADHAPPVESAEAEASTEPELPNEATESLGDAAATAAPPVSADELTREITQQVSTAIDQVAQGLANGLTPQAIGESIAGSIVTSVSKLLGGDGPTGALDAISGNLSAMDLGGAVEETVAGILGPGTALHSTLDGALQSAGTLAEDLTTPIFSISRLTDDLQSTVSSLTALPTDAAGELLSITPSLGSLLEDVTAAPAQLIEIPAVLLGAEGDGGGGGLLADVFYDDGAESASALDAADLDLADPISALAGSSGLDDAADIALPPVLAQVTSDLIGQPVSDLGDHIDGGLGSITNAFHVL